MTNEQIKKEFSTWINLDRPAVWVRNYFKNGEWYITNSPAWDENYVYIVDNEHAELRKLQKDEPYTKFQIWREFEEEWWDCECPMWNPKHKFRVKPKEWYEDPEMVDKPVWVSDAYSSKEYITLFKRYDKSSQYPIVTSRGNFKTARPVKPEECYQEVSQCK